MQHINLILIVLLCGAIYLNYQGIWSFVSFSFGLLIARYGESFLAKRLTALALVILLIGFFCIPKNKLKNADFENGLKEWYWSPRIYQAEDRTLSISKVSGTVEGSTARQGSSSFHIINQQSKGPERHGRLWQPLTLWPNSVYDLSFFVKGNLEERSLWVTVSENWEKVQSRYHVPAGSHIEWQEISTTLITDNAFNGKLIVISEALGDYYLDTFTLKLNWIETLKNLVQKNGKK